MDTLSSLYSKLALSLPRDFRLLILRPALEPDAPLRCDLGVIPLDDAPKFEALSYVWGDTTRQSFAMCAGIKIPLTDNLADALRRLRGRTRSRIIWVDALCINQKDTPERNQQILLMTEIYQRAAEVVIWLGESDDDLITPITVINDCFAEKDPPTWGKDSTGYAGNSDSLGDISTPFPMQTLSRNVMQYCSRGFEDMVRKMVDVLYGHKGEVKYQMKDPTWTALKVFYDRPWFRRVWVLQEAVVSANNKVYCGPHTMSWNSLNMATLLLSDSSYSQAWLENKSVPFHELIVTRTVYQDSLEEESSELLQGDTHTKDALSLERLLDLARSRQATDPRDKVFSVLGIAQGIEQYHFSPNYSDSMQDVYIQTTQLLIQQTKSLRILAQAGLNLDSKLPSWVPDWSTLPGGADFSRPLTGLFSASANNTYVPHPSPSSPHHLPIRGFIHDRIAALKTNMFSRFGDEFSTVNPHSDFLPNLLHPFSPDEISTPDGESPFRALGRTFTADLIPGEGSRAKPTDSRKTDIYSWLLGRADPARTPDLASDGDPTIPFEEARRVYIRDLAATTTQVLSNLKVHDFFVSEKKYIGLCPCGTAVGDPICIIFGSEVPLVLRPKGDEYLLVGGAYVHGIMDGEAMVEAERIGYRGFTLV
ncbi:hypothetical protein MMC30_002961 [Trapelia coarctata]|nr:hypothetical protein [Trapelia coarctata]